MLTPEQVEEIRLMWFRGFTLSDIAEELKIGRSTVSKYVKELQVDLRPPR